MCLEEDKRPPITSPNANKGILSVIEMCWTRDPTKRPTFQKVVRELKYLGMDKYADSPRGPNMKLIDDGTKRSVLDTSVQTPSNVGVLVPGEFYYFHFVD